MLGTRPRACRPRSSGISCCSGEEEGLPATHAQPCPLVEKDWTEEDKSREKVLLQELMTLIEQRNAIVNCLDEDRQR